MDLEGVPRYRVKKVLEYRIKDDSDSFAQSSVNQSSSSLCEVQP